jgi:hypothetical protein
LAIRRWCAPLPHGADPARLHLSSDGLPAAHLRCTADQIEIEFASDLVIEAGETRGWSVAAAIPG